MEYQFSKDFLWGAACSGPQSEGSFPGDGKAEMEWDYWFQQAQELFYDGVGPAVTSDFYHKYKEYAGLMKEIGMNSYRTSIQWSRLIKDREGTINEAGVEFYKSVIDELLSRGIEPILCLHHFDLPMYWVEKGGFENRETAEAFAAYAAKCFELFGDRVKRWLTFNEPIVITEGGYLYKNHYPAVCDAKRAALVSYHLQLASSMAVKEFRKRGGEGQIGIVLNLTPTYCKEPENAEDRRSAEIADLLFNKSFLDPSLKGEYPNALVELLKKEGICPEAQAEDLEVIRANTVDFLGVNYYHPRRVTRRSSPFTGPLMPEKYFEEYTYEGQKMNFSRGWEIYEPAVYEIAIQLRDNYGNIPWYLSENGMGVQNEEQFIGVDGIVEDDYRIEFIRDHLIWLNKAIVEGCNCFGYHLWAPFDCWSWKNAYKNRYGMIRVDRKDNCRLTVKKSGRWFRETAERGGFSLHTEI